MLLPSSWFAAQDLLPSPDSTHLGPREWLDKWTARRQLLDRSTFATFKNRLQVLGCWQGRKARRCYCGSLLGPKSPNLYCTKALRRACSPPMLRDRVKVKKKKKEQLKGEAITALKQLLPPPIDNTSATRPLFEPSVRPEIIIHAANSPVYHHPLLK